MPYCKVCRHEYAEGITRCPDCDVDLVDELPPEQESSVAQGYVRVYVAENEAEARIVESTLEEAGIKTWDQAEFGGVSEIPGLGAISREDILVLAADAEKASQVIQQALADGKKLE